MTTTRQNTNALLHLYHIYLGCCIDGTFIAEHKYPDSGGDWGNRFTWISRGAGRSRWPWRSRRTVGVGRRGGVFGLGQASGMGGIFGLGGEG